MKIKIILGMFFLMIFFPLCKEEFPTEPINVDLHIEGVVTYSDTNEPVANCSIALWAVGGSAFPNDRLVITHPDEDGRYSIRENINRNEYCVKRFLDLLVSIEGRGVVWFSSEADQNISCTEGLQIINIAVDPL